MSFAIQTTVLKVNLQAFVSQCAIPNGIHTKHKIYFSNPGSHLRYIKKDCWATKGDLVKFMLICEPVDSFLLKKRKWSIWGALLYFCLDIISIWFCTFFLKFCAFLAPWSLLGS